MSHKEHQLQKSCLSELTVSLLKEYLKVYKPTKWLFEGQGGNHICDMTLNEELKFLATECNINLENMKITWHCFRDLVYSAAKTAAIDPDVIDLMLGKAINKARLPYMKSLDITKPFTKLKETLSINGQLLVARHDDILSKMALQIKTLTEELNARDRQLALFRKELGIPEDYLSQKTGIGVEYRKTLIERIEEMQSTLDYLIKAQREKKYEEEKP